MCTKIVDVGESSKVDLFWKKDSPILFLLYKMFNLIKLSNANQHGAYNSTFLFFPCANSRAKFLFSAIQRVTRLNVEECVHK